MRTEPKHKAVLIQQDGLTIYASGFSGGIEANDETIVITTAEGTYTVGDEDRRCGWVDLDTVAWTVRATESEGQ